MNRRRRDGHPTSIRLREVVGPKRWAHVRRHETSVVFAELLGGEPEALARWARASCEVRLAYLDWMALGWSRDSRYQRVVQVIDKLNADRLTASFSLPAWMPKP